MGRRGYDVGGKEIKKQKQKTGKEIKKKKQKPPKKKVMEHAGGNKKFAGKREREKKERG